MSRSDLSGASAPKNSLPRTPGIGPLSLQTGLPHTQISPLAADRIMSSILIRISWAD
jgi:hypothetical protein